MNIALQKTIQAEGLILGQLKENIKKYLQTKYTNIPYEYALLNESNDELIKNSYVHLNAELVNDMDGRVFANLKESNYITLLFYHFKDYFNTNSLRIIGDIEYIANYELVKELRQEAINEIIKTNDMYNFSNAVVYFSDKCNEYSLQSEYFNFLGYVKKYFLKEEEKKIDAIILTESKRIQIEKEEQQKQALDKEEKNKKIKTYIKQIEKAKAKVKQLKQEVEQEV